MKRKWSVILSILMILILVVGCASKEMDTDDADMDEYNDEYEYTNENDYIIEESLSDYSDIRPILSQYQSIGKNEKFWCLAGDDTLLKTDFSGTVYSSYTRKDAKNVKAQLSENRLLFECSDGYYIYDFEPDEREVTYDYTDKGKMCYASSECIMLEKTEETYNSSNIYMYVLDTEGNELMSFSANDMSEKYGIEWERNWEYGSCGSHIYYIKTDPHGSNYCFVDLARNKAYVVKDLPLSNSGSLFSDGQYIIDNQPHIGNAAIDCDTEQVFELDNLVMEMQGLSEGKVVCSRKSDDVEKILNVDGSIALELDYENTTVTDASQFENGYAMLEFNNKFTTIIDTEGQFLFEPVEGTIHKLLNMNSTNIYIIHKDGGYYFLDEETGETKPFADSTDTIYIVSEGEENSLAIFDGEGFSIISVE